jgi:hypothetical protein
MFKPCFYIVATSSIGPLLFAAGVEAKAAAKARSSRLGGSAFTDRAGAGAIPSPIYYGS